MHDSDDEKGARGWLYQYPQGLRPGLPRRQECNPRALRLEELSRRRRLQRPRTPQSEDHIHEG